MRQNLLKLLHFALPWCDSRQVDWGIINFDSRSCSFMLAPISWWMMTIFNKTSFNGNGRSRSPITTDSSWCEEKIYCWLPQDFNFSIRSDRLITIKIGRSCLCHFFFSTNTIIAHEKHHLRMRVAHAPGMPGTFFPPPNWMEPFVSDHGMHHGTCVTHVPWCMSGSLTHGGGENVPGIPGAMGPWVHGNHLSRYTAPKHRAGNMHTNRTLLYIVVGRYRYIYLYM